MHYKEITLDESQRLDYCDEDNKVISKSDQNLDLFANEIDQCSNLIMQLSNSSDSYYLFHSLLRTLKLYPQIIYPLYQRNLYIDVLLNHFILSNSKICKIIFELLKITLENVPDSDLQFQKHLGIFLSTIKQNTFIDYSINIICQILQRKDHVLSETLSLYDIFSILNEINYPDLVLLIKIYSYSLDICSSKYLNQSLEIIMHLANSFLFHFQEHDKDNNHFFTSIKYTLQGLIYLMRKIENDPSNYIPSEIIKFIIQIPFDNPKFCGLTIMSFFNTFLIKQNDPSFSDCLFPMGFLQWVYNAFHLIRNTNSFQALLRFCANLVVKQNIASILLNDGFLNILFEIQERITPKQSEDYLIIFLTLAKESPPTFLSFSQFPAFFENMLDIAEDEDSTYFINHFLKFLVILLEKYHDFIPIEIRSRIVTLLNILVENDEEEIQQIAHVCLQVINDFVSEKEKEINKSINK